MDHDAWPRMAAPVLFLFLSFSCLPHFLIVNFSFYKFNAYEKFPVMTFSLNFPCYLHLTLAHDMLVIIDEPI